VSRGGDATVLLTARDLLPAARPPVAVAVPGLGLTVRAWHAVAARSADTVPMAVVALPAFGLRASRATPLDPASDADVLAARLRARRLDVGGPVLLLGHSASCQVVAEVARRHPTLVRGLVLVGPTTDPPAATWPRLAARWLRTAAHEDPRRVPAMVHEYATTRLSGFLRAMDRARRHDLREALGATDVPVLVLRGPHDHLAPAAWLAELAAVRPGIDVTTTGGGAHMLPLTHPGELARPVEAFSQRVCRDRSAG
jgi:pimeloyl-ACP methyl ester carboxylesterase